VVCFAAAGVAATSVRTIAAEADVSPALVIHHFGSKDQLRVACDEHVAAVVRIQKQAAMAAGAELDVLGALRTQHDGPPVLAYLARTLTDGAPHVAELVDELVADAVGYMADGVAAGVLQPSADPHARAALLTIWSLGALVLHEHTSRLLGADLLGDVGQAQGYLGAGLEVLGQGVLTPATYRAVRDQLDAAMADGAATDDPAADPPAGNATTPTDGGRP
jgi:AcrR family transcriptional regulator